MLVSGDREIAASGDGLLLRGVVADGDLPVIRMDAAPAGDRVRNANTRTALAARCAGAPTALRRRIDRLWTGPKGMMLALVDGPDLIFGDASDAPRKWLAATRVLADPSSAGATYLDVRMPERVAAGGLGPVPSRPPPGPTRPPRFRPLRPTLNRRVRMSQPSTPGRDFGALQGLLPRFELLLTSGRKCA